jgi:hypothetical protein
VPWVLNNCIAAGPLRSTGLSAPTERKLHWGTVPSSVVARSDRRRLVSSSFKRRIAVRLAVAGAIVFAAVCAAFGAVGIGIGIVVVVAGAVVFHFERRRRWRHQGGTPDTPDLFPR